MRIINIPMAGAMITGMAITGTESAGNIENTEKDSKMNEIYHFKKPDIMTYISGFL